MRRKQLRSEKEPYRWCGDVKVRNIQLQADSVPHTRAYTYIFTCIHSCRDLDTVVFGLQTMHFGVVYYTLLYAADILKINDQVTVL